MSRWNLSIFVCVYNNLPFCRPSWISAQAVQMYLFIHSLTLWEEGMPSLSSLELRAFCIEKLMQYNLVSRWAMTNFLLFGEKNTKVLTRVHLQQPPGGREEACGTLANQQLPALHCWMQLDECALPSSLSWWLLAAIKGGQLFDVWCNAGCECLQREWMEAEVSCGVAEGKGVLKDRWIQKKISLYKVCVMLSSRRIAFWTGCNKEFKSFFIRGGGGSFFPFSLSMREVS